MTSGSLLAQTTAVTLHLFDPTTSAVAKNAFIRFEIANYGTNVPRVIGTSTIIPSHVDAYPDATGLVSIGIIPNSSISPANTYYRITYFRNGNKFYTCNIMISGVSMSLDDASCMDTAPPAPLPFDQCVQCPSVTASAHQVNGVDLLDLATKPNLINGSGITVSNPSGSSIEFDFTKTLYNQTIQDNGTNKIQEPKLNLKGTAVSCVDNPGLSTDCTFTGGSSATSYTAIVPANIFTSTTGSWAGFSIFAEAHGYVFFSFPASCKILFYVASGSMTADNIKILKTALNSSTVISSTTVTVGGSSTPTLSAGFTFSDAITITLDSTHDYWVAAHFSSSTAQVGGNATISQDMVGGYISGDHTGDSTIPSRTNPNNPYLIVGLYNP